jgi:hypothetical protein
MRFRIGPRRINLSAAGDRAQSWRRLPWPVRIKVSFSDADNFCWRVKIRAKALRTLTAARPPEIFPAGLSFIKSPAVLRTLEPPQPLPGPARRVREPIDWRNEVEPSANQRT